MKLNEILNYYNNSGNNEDNSDLSDIYYYIYFYNKNNKEKGAYSENFINKHKNHKNIRICKKEFKQKIKKYNIGKDNKLRKYVSIKDKICNLYILHNLLIVPNNEIEKLLKFYHTNTGHRNYLILHDKIISDGFYWNGITNTCKNFVANCIICQTKNKSLTLPPPSNQILCKYPRELYVCDLTEVSEIYLGLNNKKAYLLSIIDHFSKLANNYIIFNKDQKTVLNKIKLFINTYGIPNKILTDNGGEFVNKTLKNYCKKNEINCKYAYYNKKNKNFFIFKELFLIF